MQVGDTKEWFGLNATTDKMNAIRGYTLSAGRFISPIDYESASKVCVIGSEVKKTFFGENVPALGKTIMVSQVGLKVIGVLSERGGRSDYVVIVPLSTYEASFARLTSTRGWGGFVIYARLKDPKRYDEARQKIIKILAARHGFEPKDEEAIRVRDFSERRAEINVLMLIMMVISYAIGVMTLAIGAVGVMNIMLVSVRERVREIGLRKAVGAGRARILAQFLTEALILTLIGGLIGIALGLLVVGVLMKSPLPEGFPPPAVSAGIVYSAIIVNIVVGIVAGTYPAMQAASLDPIVALRTE